MKKSIFPITLLLLFSLILVGCNLPGQETPESQVDLLNTAAAQTVQAQQTLIAQPTEVPRTAEVIPTETLPPTEETEAATSTLAPTATITLTPTPEGRCDQASFVTETIPDGTVFNQGQAFTKTWTLKNTGNCTWNANYDIVFFSGNAMGAPAAKQITTGTVAPGQHVTISLELQAPNSVGTHRGNFKLRNANGLIFGLGTKDSPFWVEISIPGNAYDFAKNFCAPGVKWTSGAGELPCPGTSGSDKGWVLLFDKPLLENMAIDDEPGLQVHPQKVNDGWIRGTYPEINLTSDTTFKTIVGCYGSANCDVNFHLIARVNGGAEQTLGTWHEVQDGTFKRVEVDLSSMTGKRVQFILLVNANGSPVDDLALWFAPRIEPD
ncbi:MAG: NBR1-Ig-like domain-containing protein [Brevefilum sp.]